MKQRIAAAGVNCFVAVIVLQCNCLFTLCCSYCADLVSKRLHSDVLPLIEAMRAGFHLVRDIIDDFLITASSIIHNSHRNQYFEQKSMYTVALLNRFSLPGAAR